jgi:hypothetical protein
MQNSLYFLYLIQMRRRFVVMLVAVLGQNADDYRGGWRTDSGEAHTCEFSIRGGTVGHLASFHRRPCLIALTSPCLIA